MVRVRVRMFIHLDYHATAVVDRVSHISSREDYIRPIAGTLWCLLHAGRCMVVQTWANPGLPDDLCTHTLYDYSGSQIYNIQWNYNTRSEPDGEMIRVNPHITLYAFRPRIIITM